MINLLKLDLEKIKLELYICTHKHIIVYEIFPTKVILELEIYCFLVNGNTCPFVCVFVERLWAHVYVFFSKEYLSFITLHAILLNIEINQLIRLRK